MSKGTWVMGSYLETIGQFFDFVRNADFPCVGAKSALATDGVGIVVGGDLRHGTADLKILAALRRIPYQPDPELGLISTIILFPETPELSELDFERALWGRLQALHDADIAVNPWDDRVSSDPHSVNFGFSIGGTAFFVVGLHPGASRLARRAPQAMVAFNAHAQFRQLKDEGKYARVQKVVRQRDVAIQGGINPMLAAHGEASEAAQYSGREVSPDWSCPFQPSVRESTMIKQIAPKSGVAFSLRAGQKLSVIDPMGEQVADLVAFAKDDVGEVISSGRSIDYASRIYLTTGDPLYSNLSNVMLRIIADDVGRHDFLLAPCSRQMFKILYDDPDPPPGCFGNLAASLEPFGIAAETIPTAFNCFMNVPVDQATGAIRVQPPLSGPGDRIVFQAEMDLIIGLTACSAGQSNNFSFKPIHFEIDG